MLEDLAKKIRIRIVDMVYKAGSGHAGGSLSEVEILLALYFNVMDIDENQPLRVNRDRFILSKGHASPGLYAVLSERGYFPISELDTLRQLGSRLQGHPDMKKTPGVDFSSGSLGQGLSVGCGMALGMKINNIDKRVFVLLGDGELNEGQVWETLPAAVKFKLDNLVAIIDYNGVQLDGTTEEIMPIGPLAEKFESFGWDTVTVDGHNVYEITKALNENREEKNKPLVVIANTVKGKGVPFMEHNHKWHGGHIDNDVYQRAMSELK